MAKLYRAFEGPQQPIVQKPWEREMYTALQPEYLLQQGDEYFTTDKQFVAVPLTAVGTVPDPLITFRRRTF